LSYSLIFDFSEKIGLPRVFLIKDNPLLGDHILSSVLRIHTDIKLIAIQVTNTLAICAMRHMMKAPR